MKVIIKHGKYPVFVTAKFENVAKCYECMKKLLQQYNTNLPNGNYLMIFIKVIFDLHDTNPLYFLTR